MTDPADALATALRALIAETAQAAVREAMQAQARLPDGRLGLSLNEAARSLGLSRGVVYGLVRAGELPAVQIGSRWVVSTVGLGAWLAQHAGRSVPTCPEMARGQLPQARRA